MLKRLVNVREQSSPNPAFAHHGINFLARAHKQRSSAWRVFLQKDPNYSRKIGKMKQIILFCILILLAGSACQFTGLVSATPGAAPASTLPSVTQSGASASENPGSPVPSPAIVPTAVPSPTAVTQPVFDPKTVASLDSLQGYSFKSSSHYLKGTQPDADAAQRLYTSNVVRITNPLKAHLTTTDITSGVSADQDHKYIEDWYYLGNIDYRIARGLNFFVIDASNQGRLSSINDPFKYIRGALRSARFVAEEDYHGVRVNHFTFDQNDFAPVTAEPGYKIETFSGNLYLAKDGNIPLHYDSTGSGNIWWEIVKKGDSYETVYSPGTCDISIDLDQINQVNSIDFPPDVPTQVPLQVDTPMPQGCMLYDITVSSGKPPYNYTFTCPQSLDEIFTFYQQFQPSDGWSVETAAQQGSSRMVMLKKGTQMVILDMSYSDIYKKNTIDFGYDPGK
jgi:hypothetical protein